MLHLDLLEHGGGYVLKKLLISHASLKLIWESLNSMVIFFGYEISPNMMGIQEGYNKNFHISMLNTKRSLILDDCFEIWGW